MKNIAILASGGGSNADKIMEYFKDHPTIRVSVVISNNKNAGVRQKADKHQIPFEYLSNKNFSQSFKVLPIFTKYHIHYVVLAGFLRLVPKFLLEVYPKNIVNIHPALLPQYGGKGMYGEFIHQAVFNNQEKISGISIHIVNEVYDDGELLFQLATSIEDCNNHHEIGKKVLKLEHKHYSKIIDSWISRSTFVQ